MAEKQKKATQKVEIKSTSKKNVTKAATKKGTAVKTEVKPKQVKLASNTDSTVKKEVKPIKKETKVEKKEVSVRVVNMNGKTVYHVTKRDRDGREWKVFIQGSNKVIKLFATQAEALEYAQNLCKNKDDGSYVLLHGLNGKIRKY